MWTNRQFWMDATWRCFRTFCQTLAAMLAGQTANLLTAPWSGMLSTAGGAALVSLLMSIDRERVVTTPEASAGVTPIPAEPQTSHHRLVTTEPTFQPPLLGCGAIR